MQLFVVKLNQVVISIQILYLVNLLKCFPTEDAGSTSDEEFNVYFHDIRHNDGGSHQHGSDVQHKSPIDKHQNIDYYEFRHIFAQGVGKALDECRQKFKWDRWNCPKKAFLSILDREEYSLNHDSLPANKELGLTRALIASSIVLSMIKSCTHGSNRYCRCSNPTLLAPYDSKIFQPQQQQQQQSSADVAQHLAKHSKESAPSTKRATKRSIHHNNHNHHNQQHQQQRDDPTHSSATDDDHVHLEAPSGPDAASGQNSKFAWAGCDEIVKFGFKVARMYLDSQDSDLQGKSSRLINVHNFRAGRAAVKRIMKRRCKCHGVSGTCQMNTCWTVVPNMSEISDYLKRQYHVAAKVGASSATETDATSLGKELAAISMDKLVFADVSPDYCYEHKQLGINGTLNRYCSRARFKPNGAEVSRSERDSCDRLCTKCGYKIQKELVHYEKQCDCRYRYCCWIECRRCQHTEEAYKCVKHS